MRNSSFFLAALLSITGVTSQSSPNPIRFVYPNNVTGTLNATVALVPIPFSLARSIIPAKYGILTKAYESLLPGFPKDKYPLLVKGNLDHDVGLGSFILDDFQSLHIEYPFIDLLGDGYSCFLYAHHQFLTATAPLVIGGAAVYGTTVIPASFDPALEAYAYVKSSSGRKKEEIYFDTYTNSSTCPAVTMKFTPTSEHGWPFEYFMNVTNQPFFSNGSKCDNQRFYYNTTLSTGVNAPVGVKGEVTIEAPYLQATKSSDFGDIYGFKVDAAFVENNLLDCESLKGYSWNGNGKE
ncbi:hypothetical protein BGZ60DRAFT_403461 [Tricladium varicosporioides]|nr:hypothetical protein BGZ60DRAFT_403461 [Hymenoscyphus varicosporioides]